jgi:predicted tellurium resistance membrane protein TerC
MLEWFADPDIWLSLVTLTALEVVLGIDNIVFIAIVAERLPPERRMLARRIGLGFALITRLILLFTLTWIMTLTRPLFEIFGYALSGRDLILLAGGAFLTAKAVFEIHHHLEESDELPTTAQPIRSASFVAIVAQIALLDVVFSLDSVITAVGMAQEIWVMVAAIVIAMVLMLIAAEPVSRFINLHPTLRMLALSFLILIGTMLVAEGIGFHIPKGYIYFSMAFAVLVESLNMMVRSRRRRARQHAPKT